MLDADAQGTAEEGDGVLGNELLQGDEEAGFESNEALEGCGARCKSVLGFERGLGSCGTYNPGMPRMAYHTP